MHSQHHPASRIAARSAPSGAGSCTPRTALAGLTLAVVVLVGCATPVAPEVGLSTANVSAAPLYIPPQPAAAASATPPATSGTVTGNKPGATEPPRENPGLARTNPPQPLTPRLQYTAPPGPGGLINLEVSDPQKPRTLDLTAPADDVWVRIRNGIAIPNLISPLVVERQAWFLARPEGLIRTLERSSIYLYHIVEELEKRGMPTELALLPFIESAYNPMALSTARASGMWQFIPSTGKQYNLRQDWWRDERRDIIASTEAALTYLQTIYEMHGDWHLALASYNWGEGAVKRAIDKNRALGMPTDYLSLAMPDETRYYVPKLQAIKNIVAHPELFGLTLPKVNNQPYFTMVERKRDLDIRTAAKLAQMPLADFKALNPSFNRSVMTGSGTLLVPTDRATLFENNLANHTETAAWKPYTLQKHDRIDKVAKRFGMSVADLREINGIGPSVAIKPGQTVLVRAGGPDLAAGAPRAGTNNKKAAPATRNANAKAAPAHAAKGGGKQPAAGYVVKRGDTLFGIAQKLGVSVEALKSANGLKQGKVAAGQRLRVPN